jgi:hypothetical protein
MNANPENRRPFQRRVAAEVPRLILQGIAPVSLVGKKSKNARGELALGHNWPGATGLAEDVRYYWKNILA